MAAVCHANCRGIELLRTTQPHQLHSLTFGAELLSASAMPSNMAFLRPADDRDEILEVNRDGFPVPGALPTSASCNRHPLRPAQAASSPVMQRETVIYRSGSSGKFSLQKSLNVTLILDTLVGIESCARRFLSSLKIPKTEGDDSTTSPSLNVGCRVKIRRSISTPQYGWGNASRYSQGVVYKLIAGQEVLVYFPECKDLWQGLQSELQVIRRLPFKASRPGRR